MTILIFVESAGNPLLLRLLFHFLVSLGVHQLGDDFPTVAARVEVVGMLLRLLLRALLAAVAGVEVLVMVEIVMFVLIEVALGHLDVFVEEQLVDGRGG